LSELLCRVVQRPSSQQLQFAACAFDAGPKWCTTCATIPGLATTAIRFSRWRNNSGSSGIGGEPGAEEGQDGKMVKVWRRRRIIACAIG